MQVGALWIVATDVLNEGRAVLAGSVRRPDVAAVGPEPIQRQDASQGVLLVLEGDVGRGRGPAGGAGADLRPVYHNLGYPAVLAKVLGLTKDVLGGAHGRQAHSVHEVAPDHAHVGELVPVLGRFGGSVGCSGWGWGGGLVGCIHNTPIALP